MAYAIHSRVKRSLDLMRVVIFVIFSSSSASSFFAVIVSTTSSTFFRVVRLRGVTFEDLLGVELMTTATARSRRAAEQAAAKQYLEEINE